MSKYFLNAAKDTKTVYVKCPDDEIVYINGLGRQAQLAVHEVVTESFGEAHFEVDLEAMLASEDIETEVGEDGITRLILDGCDNPAKTLKSFTVKVSNAEPDAETLDDWRDFD